MCVAVESFYQRQRQLLVLGNDAFRARVVGEVEGISSEVPGYERESQAPETSDQLVAAVAEEFGLAVADIYARPGRGHAAWHLARAVAMRLCQERAGLTLAEIGRLFGVLTIVP